MDPAAQLLPARWTATRLGVPVRCEVVDKTDGMRMRPRSIVFDLFGGYLRYHGGSARLVTLVSLLEVFGVPESTARVALARLRREGWFDTEARGRESIYALSSRSWAMLDEGRTRIFHRDSAPWDGQ